MTSPGHHREPDTWFTQRCAESREHLARHARELSAEIRAGAANPFLHTRLKSVVSLLVPRLEYELGPDGEPAVVQANRKFLKVDPQWRTSGVGRAIEVIGDLDTCNRIAIMVPGLRNNFDTLESYATRGRWMQQEAGPDTAVVLWQDYEIPGMPRGMLRAYADHAAPRLVDFVNDLNRRYENRPTTVVGMSYGALVAGQAVRDGLDCEAVIFAGSEGIAPDVRSAADLRAGERPRIFCARARRDLIASTRWFGPDPAGFTDATRIQTEGKGHESYWTPGNEFMRNVGRIVRGEYDSVTTTPPATTIGSRAFGAFMRSVDKVVAVPVTRGIPAPVLDAATELGVTARAPAQASSRPPVRRQPPGSPGAAMGR